MIVAIRHVVIWSLHRPEEASRFKSILQGCRALVEGILEFDIGIRSEGLEANADVVLVSRFANAQALHDYQNHPHHLEVLRELGAMRSARHVVDYAD